MFPFFNSSGSVNSNSNPPSAAMQQQGMMNFPQNPLQFQQPTMGPQTNIPFNYPIFPFQQATMDFNQISQNPSQLLNQNPYLSMCFLNQMQGVVTPFFPMPIQNFNGQVFPASINMPQNLPFDASTIMGLGFNGARPQLPMNPPSVQQQILTPPQRNIGAQPFRPLQLQNNLNNLQFAAGQSQGNITNPPQGPQNHIGDSHHNKNFVRNPNQQGSQSRFVKQQGQRNNTFQKFQSKAGNDDQRDTIIAKSHMTNQAEKRTIKLNYTEQEIKQWREERQKNYPTKATIEKKLQDNQKDPEIRRKNASLRCQQLKEILAKQAELGCEVAEIPSSYLSDPHAVVHGSEDTGRPFNEKDKFNRRVRLKKNHDFSKNGIPLEQNACGPVNHYAEKKREPTLLRKLLRSDIRKDKHQLLQVFRFMVMNSFFKDSPEKPLEFPQVLAREIGNEDDENNFQSNIVGRNESILEETEETVENDVDIDTNKENLVVASNEKDSGIQEEGEITD